MLDDFSALFTGIEVSNPIQYIRDWNLDLGNGNIFKSQAEKKLQKQQQYEDSLPPIQLNSTTVKARNKRSMIEI